MIPATFPAGYLSIYGRQSIQGFTPSSGYQFGVINQMSGDGGGLFSLGRSVMFPYKNQVSVIYGNVEYYLIPQSDILLTENEIIIVEPEP